jgi:hypothetical protein
MAWLRYNAVGGNFGPFCMAIVPNLLPDGSIVQSLCFDILNVAPDDMATSIFSPIERILNKARDSGLVTDIDEKIEKLDFFFGASFKDGMNDIEAIMIRENLVGPGGG